MATIPFAEEQEGLPVEHQLILNSLMSKAMGLPEGFNASYTFGIKKTPPTPEQFKALLSAAGVDPAKDADLRNQQITELKDIAGILAQNPEPRSLDLAPAYAFSKGIYGRDVTPSKPAEEGGFDVATQLSLRNKINELVKSGTEEGVKLASLASKLGTTEPSGKYSMGKTRPSQIGVAQQASYDKEFRGALGKLSEEKNTVNQQFGNIQKALDSNDSAYIKAMGTSISRQLGEKGVITDKDIERSNISNFARSVSALQAWWESRPVQADPASLQTMKTMIMNMKSLANETISNKKNDLVSRYKPFGFWSKEHEAAVTGVFQDKSKSESPAKKSLMDMFKEWSASK